MQILLSVSTLSKFILSVNRVDHEESDGDGAAAESEASHLA